MTPFGSNPSGDGRRNSTADGARPRPSPIAEPGRGAPPPHETAAIGSVVGLWRYPVKSFGGEACRELELDARGVVSDRLWALVREDGKIASGKRTRRFRRVDGLLLHGALLGSDGAPLLRLADGRTLPPSDELALELAGPGWRFGREREIRHHDSGGIHLVTTASLAALGDAAGEPVEVQRLRPNLLVDAGAVREEGWLGKRLRIGSVELEVTARAVRCVMVGLPQPGLPRRRTLLRTIGHWNEVCAGVYAEVVRPGRLREGDAVVPAAEAARVIPSGR